MSFKENITSHLRAGQETELEGEERELFVKGRGAIARWAEKLPHPHHPDCTGLGASYCSVHGDCTCDLLPSGETSKDTPGCPLHGTWRPSGIVCDACAHDVEDQDIADLSQIRFRSTLCRGCFDKVRAGAVPRPDPTRKVIG